MSYRHFSLCCRCGLPPTKIDEIGVTDDHELVIHWWCEDCRKLVWASKPLSECWRECPATDTQPDFDAEFLQSVGVRLA
jgi:hypothetical protein